MTPKVYFTNFCTTGGETLPQKLARLLLSAGMDQIDFKGKYVAIKIHFGELGNMAYLRPGYARVVVDLVKDLGGKPFLTDANTMYVGSRKNALDHLETVASWGVRLINPVWNNANVLSGSCADEPDRGLSVYGREFVAKMYEYGIFADVSHISDAGFWDVIQAARGPVVASHSNARAPGLCPHRRNLTDDMFRAVRDTGGVVGINLYLDFVGGGHMDDLIAHIEHFLSLSGESTVAIGGDLDGCEALAAGMTGVQDVAKLYQKLEERGYPRPLLEDIFWNNWRRIL